MTIILPMRCVCFDLLSVDLDAEYWSIVMMPQKRLCNFPHIATVRVMVLNVHDPRTRHPYTPPYHV